MTQSNEPRFLELPVSGTVVDINNVSFVSRADINKFVIFTKTMAPNLPTIDGIDRDALMWAMNEHKLLMVVKADVQPQAEEPKAVIASA